ncbi:hypothetical protein NDI44_27465 [Trichocoleus sp. DQ-A3]|uniref:hypothetical protein n=1 Tax=Cyanophyceae TaxID=3028117 RepID=UPI0016827717|nr:hypothetical protein [Coleofasciculus sp. FACHB-125]MBD1903612.1 hypothetical protein [Coleofasciculus sp. FACHB-125]
MRFRLKFLGGWRWLAGKHQPVSGKIEQRNEQLKCVQHLTASLGIVTKLATISVRRNPVFNPLRHLWMSHGFAALPTKFNALQHQWRINDNFRKA